MGKEFSFDQETSGEAEEIASHMPQPSEHALSQMEETQTSGGEESPAAPQEGAPKVDDFGTPFDPEKHTGSKLKNGRWRERKKSVVAAPRGKKKDATPQPSPQDIKRAENEAQCRAAGVVAAGAMFMLCRGIMGEEWTPSNDEIEMQNQNWGNYFVAKGISDIPPGAALFMGICAYAAPRFTKPKTQAKVSAAREWITLRIARWKIRRELKKRGIAAEVYIQDGEVFINGTRADSWNDGKRQDDKSASARR